MSFSIIRAHTVPMMPTLRPLILFVACSVLLPATATVAAEPVDYLEQIKPIFARRCGACHGALKQESGLRLDTSQGIRTGGDNGSAIVAGDAAGSLLIERVTAEPDLRMPPEGKPLTAREIDLLRQWIALGAEAPAHEEIPDDPHTHWAYQRPVRPPVPQPASTGWVRTPIDAFVAVGHQQQGLSATGPAPKEVLLRRVYLDLIGLPPTPAELRAFLDDDSPHAYEAVVERLLANPQYGERWGRHWMDVWRYSDFYGYKEEIRNSARHIWRWRDWIIESLNGDAPYDEMILDMLAADELAPTDLDRMRATGFLARQYFKFNRNVWLDRALEHTGKAFLGITLNCARCHDHKYDPIAQEEYYQLRAFFEPYRVRTDRLPGEADVMKDGLARAYDADLNAQTFVFARGNEAFPDKEHPVGPAIPAFFDADRVEIREVSLPPLAYYPGLRSYIRQEEQAAARTEVSQKAQAHEQDRQALAAAERDLAELAIQKPAVADDELAAAQQGVRDQASALGVSEKELLAAKARLHAVAERVEADKAKFAAAPDENAVELARAASLSERTAKLRMSEAVVARAELALSQAERQPKQSEKKRAKVVSKAGKALSEAKKQLAAAQKSAAEAGEDYETITPVYPQTSTGRRLALARWIVDDDNPLTARVAVNHIWLRHFGKPLVPTVFDFGMNGQPPSYAELLDWLAVELVESGWSTRRLHRLMVLSNVYRMHSTANGAAAENTRIDPDNRWLWRMNTRRLESEVVRDSLLAVSGQLDCRMGGAEIDACHGQTTYRRSIYYRHAPEKFMTFLKLFDAASTDECYRRNETVVPQQALAMANSRLAREQARRLAALLNREVGTAADSAGSARYIDALYQRVLSRRPTAAEQDVCSEFLTTQTKRLGDDSRLTTFSSGTKPSVPPAEDPRLRARENLAHVLLNHHEFVTGR
jgi:mono/diheme cytochrome c family protein